MKTTTTAMTVLAGLSVSLASAPATAQSNSSTLSSFFTSVADGVGSEIGSTTVGWALSAIGLAGGASATNDLEMIETELNQINGDLVAIHTELVAILDAIGNQTCVDTETESDLNHAIDNITTLFGNYQTEFIQPAQAGDPIIQAQLDSWKRAVLDESDGIRSNLAAIHNAIYNETAPVLQECIQSVNEDYYSGTGPLQYPFDDRPYYEPILNTVNYYYGVQIQGAALLSEALHLEACQEAAKTDTGLNCDFQTVSTSTSPTMAYDICNDPSGTVATFCLEAQEVVTDPETGTGVYERVTAQMIFAGAPYTTDEIGMLWGTSLVFAKSVDHFTNQATVSGNTLSDCAIPITASDPCGFTVGPYDLSFDSQLTYAGYPYGTDTNIWRPASAGELADLLETWNAASSGNTTSTLGVWMNSIGFTQARNKIISTPTTDTLSSLEHTSAPITPPLSTFCFMDTNFTQDDPKTQPYCAENRLLEVNPDGDGDVNQQIEADFTKSSADPTFYDTEVTVFDFDDSKWNPKPGWSVDQQSSSAFHQLHWPRMDLSDVHCNVRAQGQFNPGGTRTMCGSDLQAYIDNLMPPPQTSTTAVAASADATLLGADRNRNGGASLQLELLPLAGHDANDVVIRFPDDAIARFLDGVELAAATLRLTFADSHGHWDRHGRSVTVRSLKDPFVEGNGNPAANDRGTGTGATWNCAEDTDISDEVEECVQNWSRSSFAPPRRRHRGRLLRPSHEAWFDRDSGAVHLDVTADVRRGVSAWIVRKDRWRRHGGSFAYHSREGAAEMRDPTLAPTLILNRAGIPDVATTAD